MLFVCTSAKLCKPIVSLVRQLQIKAAHYIMCISKLAQYLQDYVILKYYQLVMSFDEYEYLLFYKYMEYDSYF